MPDKIKCSKCGRLMVPSKFFKKRDGTFSSLCKADMTMHVDNFDPETYLWILEELDFPYIPDIWIPLANKEYLKDPETFNGASVLGKYLAQMRLNQKKNLGWADTEKLKEKAEARRLDDLKEKEEYRARLKQELEEGKITQKQFENLAPTEDSVEELKRAEAVTPIKGPGETLTENKRTPQPVDAMILVDETKFISEDELPDPAESLTQEDKITLAIKWGRTYTPNEWIKLETDYTKMKDSFDVQDADSENTLLLLCKTHLKMDQAIDMGDLDGYTKLSKVYESLRKSASFTAAQNKKEKGNYVDSIGQLVALCEKEGHFIPRYAPEAPQDMVDAVLLDTNKYLNNLVKNEMGFGQQIEDALQRISITMLEEKEEQERIASGEIEDPSLFTNEDMIENYERISEEIEADVETLRSAGEE